jgi:hypothetical protein
MADAQEVIRAIHAVAASEVAYENALNMGRGLKTHEARLARDRLALFRLAVGREPTEDEQSALLWDDA